jgi:protein SCO1/2
VTSHSRTPLLLAAALAAAALVVLAVQLTSLVGSPVGGRPPGAASIGAPFELTAHDGSRFSSARLAGKPYLLFFGFTHCPDVCPTTLLEIGNLLAALKVPADALGVLLVSVDPERDSPAQLARYLSSFDARVIGLTGTPVEVAAVVQSHRAFSEKVPGRDGAYTVNHTASVYMFDAKGRFAGTFNYQEPEEARRAKLARLLK